MEGFVYLIHFERPIAPGKHTTQHYVGWEGVKGSRIQQHKKGIGSRLCQVAMERGIAFDVVLTVQGDRGDERRLKNSHNLRMVCPLCHDQWAQRKRQAAQQRRAARKRFAAMQQYVMAALCWQSVLSALCAIIYFRNITHARRGGSL